MVRSWLGQAAGQHISVSDRLDFLDSKVERQPVKLRKQSVQKTNQIPGRQLGRKPGKADEIGEQNCHLRKLIRDDGLTAIQTRDDGLRQNVEEEVFRPLLFDS